MAEQQLRILAIGAHPDDCEGKVGGTAALWARAGHLVRFVSATNGAAGHHEQAGSALVRRRVAEARAAAEVLGVESQILHFPDGGLTADLASRETFIRLIRRFRPDLILTHRPGDYHPDHRYTSQLVADATFLVTVPNLCPGAKALTAEPAVAYFPDAFVKPTPFAPDVVIDIDAAVEAKHDALHRHTSQMYEWLPWHGGLAGQVPAEDAERRRWLGDRRIKSDQGRADRFRAKLIARYGPGRGGAVRCAEAFEACEYGAPLNEARIARLFGGL